MKKTIAILLICSTVVLSMVACSTFRKNVWWPATEKQATALITQVRPAAGNPESHYLLGCYYQEQGMHHEALGEFKKTIAINPEFANAYNGIGISYDHMKDYSAAVAAYEAALKLNPRLDYVHNNLGYSHFLQGNYDKAVSALEKAVALSDGSLRMHNNLGLAYARVNDFTKAMRAFAAAGGEAQARYNLSQIQSGLDNASRPRQKENAALNGTNASADLRPDLSVRNDSTALERKRKEERTGIEVSNGNGINNMARNVGRYLKQRGFSVVRLSNADHFAYRSAVIHYRDGFRNTALEISRKLPKAARVEKINDLERDDIKIKVLLGRDFVRHEKIFSGGRNRS